MLLDPLRRYYRSPAVVRCRGIENITELNLMSILGREFYASRRPDQIEVNKPPHLCALGPLEASALGGKTPSRKVTARRGEKVLAAGDIWMHFIKRRIM